MAELNVEPKKKSSAVWIIIIIIIVLLILYFIFRGNNKNTNNPINYKDSTTTGMNVPANTLGNRYIEIAGGRT
jgi:preprotein translocase subunit YajC